MENKKKVSSLFLERYHSFASAQTSVMLGQMQKLLRMQKYLKCLMKTNWEATKVQFLP